MDDDALLTRSLDRLDRRLHTRELHQAAEDEHQAVEEPERSTDT